MLTSSTIDILESWGPFDKYTFLVETATFDMEILPHPFNSYTISSFNRLFLHSRGTAQIAKVEVATGFKLVNLEFALNLKILCLFDLCLLLAVVMMIY